MHLRAQWGSVGLSGIHWGSLGVNGTHWSSVRNVYKPKIKCFSIQARKKSFCRVIVRNYLYNEFAFKQSTWRGKIKEQTPQLVLLYCGRTVKTSHRRCSIKKAVLKNFAIFTGKHPCWGLLLIKFKPFKKEIPTLIFPVDTAKFLRKPILKNIWTAAYRLF